MIFNESILVFATRYAHNRNTGAAFMMVSGIVSEWDNISDRTKEVLYRESFEARYNAEDWKILQDKYEAEKKEEN